MEKYPSVWQGKLFSPVVLIRERSTDQTIQDETGFEQCPWNSSNPVCSQFQETPLDLSKERKDMSAATPRHQDSFDIYSNSQHYLQSAKCLFINDQSVTDFEVPIKEYQSNRDHQNSSERFPTKRTEWEYNNGHRPCLKGSYFTEMQSQFYSSSSEVNGVDCSKTQESIYYHFQIDSETQIKLKNGSTFQNIQCERNYKDSLPSFDFPLSSGKTDCTVKRAGKLKSFEKDKFFGCPYCKVTCSNRGQLLGHIRIHTGRLLFNEFDKDCVVVNSDYAYTVAADFT